MQRAHSADARPTAGDLAPPARELLSFEDFYATEAGRLFGALQLITGSAYEAEDILQEAFLKLLERWDRIDRVDDPQAYLFRTAMNAFRSRSRRVVVAARRAAGLYERSDPIVQIEIRDDVDRALSELAPRQRAALVLTELFDLSSDEVGKLLGISAGTVRMHASRGRVALRRAIGDEDD